MEKKPLIIAHRGASGNAPENTLIAFKKAIEAGADLLELDVHLTADNRLAVIHDPTLDRTTTGKGRVIDFTAKELQQFDAGSWFDTEFAAARIPLLEEVLALTDGQVGLNIEVKIPNYPNRKGLSETTKEVLAQIISSRQCYHQVLVSSFDYPFLAALHAVDPRIPLAYLFCLPTPEVRANIKEGILSALHPEKSFVSSRLLKAAQEARLAVNVWTVNKPHAIRKFAALGVNGIISNYPERAIHLSNVPW